MVKRESPQSPLRGTQRTARRKIPEKTLALNDGSEKSMQRKATPKKLQIPQRQKHKRASE
jgi:hypothetical protein